MRTAPEKVSIMTMIATINSAVSLVTNGAKHQQGQIIGIYEHYLKIKKPNGIEVDIRYEEINALDVNNAKLGIRKTDRKLLTPTLPNEPGEAISIKSIAPRNLPEFDGTTDDSYDMMDAEVELYIASDNYDLIILALDGTGPLQKEDNWKKGGRVE
jgi:hypothetical protein